MFIVLTNFTARIKESIVRHEGGREIVRYRIEATHSNPTIGCRTITIDADQYASMAWVYRLGAEFAIAAGMSKKEHTRCGIQTLSEHNGIKSVVEHTSMGWIRHNDQNYYIHAGGAI